MEVSLACWRSLLQGGMACTGKRMVCVRRVPGPTQANEGNPQQLCLPTELPGPNTGSSGWNAQQPRSIAANRVSQRSQYSVWAWPGFDRWNAQARARMMAATHDTRHERQAGGVAVQGGPSGPRNASRSISNSS